MSGPGEQDTDRLLSSWKEIATCLNRGVRTVQRWEQFGLPIRRPSKGTNVVLALESDLRKWVIKSKDDGAAINARDEYQQLTARLEAVKSQFREIDARLSCLHARLEQLKPRHRLPRAS